VTDSDAETEDDREARARRAAEIRADIARREAGVPSEDDGPPSLGDFIVDRTLKEDEPPQDEPEA
jgi:hypothetical protein